MYKVGIVRPGDIRASYQCVQKIPKEEESCMQSSDYNRYLAAIKAANDVADKETLRQIQKDMIKNYGLADNDVDYLIRQFRYNI